MPLTGLPAGISSRSSGPPRPSSPVTLQGYHVFPRPSRENFSGFGGPPAAHFSQQLFLFMPPAAYFLSTATKSMQKTPPKTNGFWISFCVQEHDLLWAVKGIDSATVPLPLPLRRRKYYVYRWGDPFPTVEQHVPSNSQCSGSVSRNTSIPCFGRT